MANEQNLVRGWHGKRPRITPLMHYQVLCMFIEGATMQEIVDDTGISRASLQHYINAFHDPIDGPNLIYISKWHLDKMNRWAVKEWKWGPGKPDVPRPAPLPSRRSAQDARNRLHNAITGGAATPFQIPARRSHET